MPPRKKKETPPERERLLDVRGLRVAYGKAQVLNGVDLHVGKGELVAVVGPNGAGKTTLLRALSRLLPSAGEVTFAGAPLPATTVATVRAGLVHCPERRRLFPGLTVRDNLELGAHRHGRASADDLDRVHALFPRLADRGSQAAGTLSGGEQQQLAIGRALMARPVLLLLDEPSLGLSIGVKEAIAAGVSALKESDITMLLVEQDVTFAFACADRAVVLEHGEVAVTGTATEVAADPYVKQAYLGM